MWLSGSKKKLDEITVEKCSNKRFVRQNFPIAICIFFSYSQMTICCLINFYCTRAIITSGLYFSIHFLKTISLLSWMFYENSVLMNDY